VFAAFFLARSGFRAGPADPDGGAPVNIEQDMRRILKEAARLGLERPDTSHMLKRHGAVTAARRHLSSPGSWEHDIVKLSSLGRLDLTVEAVVLRNAPCFHEGEVVAALRRLGPHGYSLESFAAKIPPR
jgi:hypothetical protein